LVVIVRSYVEYYAQVMEFERFSDMVELDDISLGFCS